MHKSIQTEVMNGGKLIEIARDLTDVSKQGQHDLHHRYIQYFSSTLAAYNQLHFLVLAGHLSTVSNLTLSLQSSVSHHTAGTDTKIAQEARLLHVLPFK